MSKKSKEKSKQIKKSKNLTFNNRIFNALFVLEILVSFGSIASIIALAIFGAYN